MKITLPQFFNQEEKETDTIKLLKSGRKVAGILGYLGVTPVIYGQVYGATFDAFGQIGANIICLMSLALFGFLIDYMYVKLTPVGYASLFSGKTWRNSEGKFRWNTIVFSVLLWLFAMSLGAITATFSYIGRHDAADGLVAKAKTKDIVAVKDSLSNKSQGQLAKLEGQIQITQGQIRDIDNQIEAETKRAKALVPTSVKKVKDKQDPWGYHQKVIDKKIASLTKDEKKQKDKLLDKLDRQQRLFEDQTKMLTAQDTSAIASVMAGNQKAELEEAQKKSRVADVAKYIGFISFGFVLISSILLGLIHADEINTIDIKEDKEQFNDKRRKAALPHEPEQVFVRGTNEHVDTAMLFDKIQAEREAIEALLEDKTKEQEDKFTRTIQEVVLGIQGQIEKDKDNSIPKRTRTKQQKDKDKTASGNLSLNDRKRKKLSFEVKLVNGKVVLNGKVISKTDLVNRAKKYYERSKTGTRPKSMQDNQTRWDRCQPILKQLGYTWQPDGQKVSIRPKQ